MWYGPPPPQYGYPVYPPMPQERERKRGRGHSEAVRLAKEILKQHKMDRKKKRDDERKKELHRRPYTFTFLETVGLILLGSIPLTLFQLWLLKSISQTISASFQ